MLGRGSDAISPTAHYTGAVWARAGLSHPALTTAEGRAMHAALRPAMTASALAGGPTLERFLLARHRAIDARLEAAIRDGRVGQVVELAAGLSPRGWRFHDRLPYVEADLPAMAERKRRALERMGGGPRVVALDVLEPRGLEALADGLEPGLGVAVVTEGLLNYFARDTVEGLWRRIAALLERFPAGVYLSDLVVRGDAAGPAVRGFELALSVFVRGRIHLHYAGADAARAALVAAGFTAAELERADPLVRVVEASV